MENQNINEEFNETDIKLTFEEKCELFKKKIDYIILTILKFFSKDVINVVRTCFEKVYDGLTVIFDLIDTSLASIEDIGERMELAKARFE